MKEMLNYAWHCKAVSKSDFCVYGMFHKCCGIETGLSLIVAAVGDAGPISCLIPRSSQLLSQLILAGGRMGFPDATLKAPGRGWETSER